ncbi:MAG: S8 family serine peptidase [Anaerolineae bacterium]
MSIRTLLKRLIAVGLLCIAPLTMLGSTVWAGPMDVDGEDDDYEIGQVVVRLNPDAGDTIAAINATYGTITIGGSPYSAGIYLLQLPPETNPKRMAQRMRRDARLLHAEPNFLSQVPESGGNSTWAWGGNDSAPLLDQYAVNLINLASAHDISDGDGAVVAVLDTGVQLDHPALEASLTEAGYDFVDDDPVPEDEFNGLDEDGDGVVDEAAGHGTHVAGMVHLVAPSARIMPLRVLNSDGLGNVFTIAEAILFAAQNGADIINLSLGMSKQSRLLANVTEDVTERGIVVVAAAGNLNTDVEQYPAAEESVLGVTSVGPTGEKSAFANFGDWIDVAAPGENIYSAFPVSGYAWLSGTSMAAPFVAGQAALIRSVDPSLSAEDVGSLIKTTAQPLDALNPDYAGELGAGLIDIGDSLMTIEIRTNQPPACSSAAPSVETIWPPNHNLVPVNVLGIADPDDDLVSIVIDSIRQDEPVGNGKHSPDGGGVGTSTAEVRAERDEDGNGRVYHIGFTADDGRGGSCSGEVLVGVPYEQRNGSIPADEGALYDSTGPAS